jgi:hypothetical protein
MGWGARVARSDGRAARGSGNRWDEKLVERSQLALGELRTTNANDEKTKH